MESRGFHTSSPVKAALESGKAVVALETTILSHGMPYPTNLETALAVEDIIREVGAVPATIGIVDGVVTVGMTESQLEMFATKQGIVKAVERDIPMVVARGLNGATTVGSSLAITAAAGISIFVTGGIGAVAPQAGATFDISADLLAIARYPVVTVCAGAKAFMDISGTLEYLETQSVPVIGFGTDTLPLFYSRDSGFRLEWRCDDVREVAQFLSVQREMGIERGILVGVPIPQEDALDYDLLQGAIDTALSQAKAAGKRGKEMTPYVLAAIKEGTGGRSLTANVSLVKNNARVGAGIATALAERS
jgi:pseudouridylate synthase